MIPRRTFIKSTALTALGTAFLPQLLKAAPSSPDIGLQLYTVRDAISADLKGTLKKIKRIGYTWLEAAGYEDGLFYGLPPAEFRKMIEGMGMKVVGSHVMFNADKQKEAIAAHAELGVEYVVFPSFPVASRKSKDDFLQAAARLNAIGSACSKAGMKFAYHNHDFEFLKIDDSRGYDLLIQSTEPGLVCFEADIYWMKYAGVDPLAYFDKYPGRFDLWHVKDMKDGPDKGFTEVGTGIIRYDEIFGFSDRSGMKYFFVEQDDCEKDPMESVAISYNNLYSLLSKE
jgi:sugar phosphate isomerase/epimerase